MTVSRLIGTLALALAFQFSIPSVASADEVLDWNTIAIGRDASHRTAIPAFLQPRALAIVHASIFDALNGIERDYEPIHVDDPAPRRASRRAAVVQAAYRSLVTMFPTQAAALDIATSRRHWRRLPIRLTRSSAAATGAIRSLLPSLAWRQIIIPRGSRLSRQRSRGQMAADTASRSGYPGAESDCLQLGSARPCRRSSFRRLRASVPAGLRPSPASSTPGFHRGKARG